LTQGGIQPGIFKPCWMMLSQFIRLSNQTAQCILSPKEEENPS
jgi:hypothetical protein